MLAAVVAQEDGDNESVGLNDGEAALEPITCDRELGELYSTERNARLSLNTDIMIGFILQIPASDFSDTFCDDDDDDDDDVPGWF